MNIRLWSKFPVEAIESDRSEVFGIVLTSQEDPHLIASTLYGWYAVSTHALCANERLNRLFGHRKPVDFVGYSIHIFQISQIGESDMSLLPE